MNRKTYSSVKKASMIRVPSGLTANSGISIRSWRLECVWVSECVCVCVCVQYCVCVCVCVWTGIRDSGRVDNIKNKVSLIAFFNIGACLSYWKSAQSGIKPELPPFLTGVFAARSFRSRVVTTGLNFYDVNLTTFALYFLYKQVTMVEVHWQGALSAELPVSGF